jgi:alkylation response protein AidB-like acyl-CoA dehydrogenase
MQLYKAPLRDMRFVLHELHDSASLSQLRGLEDVSPDLLDSVLEEAAKLTQEVLLPTNAPGDESGCVLENGVVRTPKGFKEAYDTFRGGGWTALAADPKYGGQVCPKA